MATPSGTKKWLCNVYHFFQNSIFCYNSYYESNRYNKFGYG